MNEGQLLNQVRAGLQPQLNVATPINDVQLLCLMAAHAPSKQPKEAAAWAVKLFAECVIQGGGTAIKEAIDKRRAEK